MDRQQVAPMAQKQEVQRVGKVLHQMALLAGHPFPFVLNLMIPW
jgi:hypothetical protein